MDIVDRKTRSRYMAAVKSRGNISTEAKMVRLLKEKGLKGWRRPHSTFDGYTPNEVYNGYWQKNLAA